MAQLEPVAKELKPITKWAQAIDKSMSESEKVIQELRERLSPVLSPESIKPTKDADKMPSMSDHAQYLCQVATRQEIFVDMLKDILTRLDLP